MSGNRRIACMFSFNNRSHSLFEKKFVLGYQSMKMERIQSVELSGKTRFFQKYAVEFNQAGLQKELSEKSKLCKSFDHQLKSTQEILKYANRQLFGDSPIRQNRKRQRVKLQKQLLTERVQRLCQHDS